jgi:hypothetical protein
VCGIKYGNKGVFLLVLIDLVVPLRRETITLKFNNSKTNGKDKKNNGNCKIQRIV